MEIIFKKFDELDIHELFEIYKLRQEVFIVEQTCIYNDIDDIDKSAYHLYALDAGELVAYARVFQADEVRVQIGRVLSKYRKKGYGELIIRESLKLAKRAYPGQSIYVEAQSYVKGLYEKLGFVQVSDEFLDTGIPHVMMLYKDGGCF